MTLLTGFNHAALITNDIDRLIAFYTSVFDAQLIFDEVVPQFRHAILRIGERSVLHPVQVLGNPHGRGLPEMLRRGHLDHLGLDVPSLQALQELRRRLVACGASDGVITDYGPQLSFSFVDPDGMHAEVCWLRDATLSGFHAPQPWREAA
jgi:catechol 2,3-dioxygenase-like lactoylglutathione lyase family enzyme